RSMYPQGCGGSSPFFGTSSPGVLRLRSGFRQRAPAALTPAKRLKFRSMYPQGRGGSSPFFDTIEHSEHSEESLSSSILFGQRGLLAPQMQDSCGTGTPAGACFPQEGRSGQGRLFNFESNNWSASAEKRSLELEV